MSEAYELSRRIFEMNASSLGDVTLESDPAHADNILEMVEVAHMQMELNRWQIRNFGVSSDVALALGFYGEIDELLEGSATKEDRVDAWCDMAIFAGQLLMNNRMSIAPVFFGWAPDMASIPSLSHIVLKHAQGIRGVDDYRKRLFDAIHIVLYRAWEAHIRLVDQPKIVDAYLRVGAEVLKRDWRKFPLNGRDQ